MIKHIPTPFQLSLKQFNRKEKPWITFGIKTDIKKKKIFKTVFKAKSNEVSN